MNPTILIFGIQATLRAAQAGADLYGEHARDRKVFLPNLELPEGSRAEQLLRFLKENPQVAGTNRDLSDLWDEDHKELRSTKPGLPPRKRLPIPVDCSGCRLTIKAVHWQ